MKHAVSSYSFSQRLDTGEMSLPQAIAQAARWGYEAFEFAGFREEPYGMTAASARDACNDAGLAVCAYMTSCNFALPVMEQRDALLREIDTAATMGTNLVRTDIYASDVPAPFAPDVLQALRDAAQHAQGAGICLVTENHGGYFCLPDRLEQLVQRVAHDNFGLLFDIANFADADSDPARAFGRLKSYVRHVHVKDAHLKSGELIYPGEGWYVTRGGNYLRCAITGHGNLPVYQVLKMLHDMAYDGYLVQEFEGVEDCLFALEQGLANTKRMLAAAKLGLWPGM